MSSRTKGCRWAGQRNYFQNPARHGRGDFSFFTRETVPFAIFCPGHGFGEFKPTYCPPASLMTRVTLSTATLVYEPPFSEPHWQGGGLFFNAVIFHSARKPRFVFRGRLAPEKSSPFYFKHNCSLLLLIEFNYFSKHATFTADN